MRKVDILVIFSVLTLLFLLLFSSFASAINVLSDPSRIGVGARPLGMGKAFVGLADDGNAIFLNPAGMGGFKSMTFTSMVGSFGNEVTYYTVGLAGPSDIGTFGIGYIGMVSPTIPTLTLAGVAPPSFSTNYTGYNGGVAYISYGLSPFKEVSFGLSGKIFLQQLTGSGLEAAAGTGLDFDAGILIEPLPWAGVGVTAVNALNFDSGGKFIWLPNPFSVSETEEDLPILYKAGAAVRIFGRDGMTDVGDHELVLAFDTEMDPENPNPNVWYAGLEWTPTKNIAVRGGVDQLLVTGGTDPVIQNNYTGGVGFLFSGFTFDYAYHQYGEESTNSTDYFSIGYIGEDEEEEVEELVMEEVPEPQPVTEEVVEKPELVTFVDVPEGHWAKAPIENLATLGIFGGYPDGTFHPESELTRAELATILVRARGIEPRGVTEAPFPDVAADHWAAKYVKTASDLKFVTGYPDGTFNPGGSLTRAEAVVVIVRFANISSPENITSRAFIDLPIEHWATPFVWRALEAGMLDYLGGGDFEPNRKTTRSEIAEILSKTPWGKSQIETLTKPDEQ
jgi:hypothetical protein